MFTPCLTGTKDLETLLLTDQAALPYLGMLGYYPVPGHYKVDNVDKHNVDKEDNVEKDNTGKEEKVDKDK